MPLLAALSTITCFLTQPLFLKSLMRWELLQTTQVMQGRGLPAEADAVLDHLCKCQGQLTMPSVPGHGDDDSARGAFAKQAEGLRVPETIGLVSKGEEQSGACVWRFIPSYVWLPAWASRRLLPALLQIQT